MECRQGLKVVDITRIWGDLDQDENFVYKDRKTKPLLI